VIVRALDASQNSTWPFSTSEKRHLNRMMVVMRSARAGNGDRLFEKDRAMRVEGQSVRTGPAQAASTSISLATASLTTFTLDAASRLARSVTFRTAFSALGSSVSGAGHVLRRLGGNLDIRVHNRTAAPATAQILRRQQCQALCKNTGFHGTVLFSKILQF